jgi:hypothetical protein
MFQDLDEIAREILRKYKPALNHIGVDFNREDVIEAIVNCYFGLEEAFQATIDYWMWKQQLEEKLEYPNAFLIKAINGNWKPKAWQDKHLNNPNFKSNCQLWWEEAEKIWGKELRDRLVADVSETDSGYEYILFFSGRELFLNIAKLRDWEWILDYARSSDKIE